MQANQALLNDASIDDRFPVRGAGLGLRRSLMADLAALEPLAVDFMEIAPENWVRVGGRCCHAGRLRSGRNRRRGRTARSWLPDRADRAGGTARTGRRIARCQIAQCRIAQCWGSGGGFRRPG